MFDKFEKFMNRYLTPIANKMDKQQHLNAIKKSMVAMTPILIIGSLFAVIPALPNMLPQGNFISNFITSNAEIIDLPVTLSLGLMGLYVCLAIAYALGEHYKLYIPGCITLAGFGFLFLVISFTNDGGMVTKYLGAKGLFISMVSAMLAVELYRWCTVKKFTIKMPEGVPDFVSRSFEMIPTTIIVVGVFITIRQLSVTIFGTLPPEVLTKFLSPLIGSMDNPLVFSFVTFLSCLLFFFGIHPSVLSPITGTIGVQFLAENITAMQSGQPLPHFYTGGMVSAFANFTGTGITFGLVFWCLLSKSKAYKRVGQVSLIPALFGINEPILFGAPIVLNPTFFIPYVVGGAILGSFPGFLMYFGLLDKPFFNPPYVGVFLEGFLVNGDWRTIIVNAIQMIGSVLVWYPFFKMFEKRVTEENNKKVISDEDEALLKDLDLDF